MLDGNHSNSDLLTCEYIMFLRESLPVHLVVSLVFMYMQLVL